MYNKYDTEKPILSYLRLAFFCILNATEQMKLITARMQLYLITNHQVINCNKVNFRNRNS